MRSNHAPFFFGIPAIVWQILLFYIPIFLLIVGSIVQWQSNTWIPEITLKKFIFFLHPTYLRIIAASLLLSFSNALICFLIAYPLAHFIAFRGKKWGNLLLFLLIVPFWTNFLLHVYAWFFVLEKHGLINTILLSLHLVETPILFLNSLFSTMIMMVYYYMPFMLLPIYASLEKFDTKLIEASYDLGASKFQTLIKILLPLSARGIKTGFFLVYIPSFGEFAIPELMGGDRYMFVGTVVSEFILGDETGSLGAAFTVLSCVCLFLSALLLYPILTSLLQPRFTEKKCS